MPRIDSAEMVRLRREGRTLADIARKMGVSISAVSQSLKKNSKDMLPVIGIERAGAIIDADLDLVRELSDLNRIGKAELNRALREMDKDGADWVLIQGNVTKLLAELRKQIAQASSVLELYAKLKGFEEFQNEVIQILGEIDEATRAKFVKRLREKRLLRSSVRFT